MILGMELIEVHKAWGAKIRRLRRDRDLPATVLAEKTGITRQYLHAIERGAYAPSEVVRLRIATALEVEVGEIFSYDLKDAS
jgi:DNA-binding XRE family transcriptional regulator